MHGLAPPFQSSFTAHRIWRGTGGAAALLVLFMLPPARAAAPRPATSRPAVAAFPRVTTAPAATSRTALRPGEQLPAEDLLAELAFRTGIIIVKADSLPGEVTITQDLPPEPEKAVSAVNEMLAPLGYRAIHVKNTTSAHLVLRILSFADARKEELQTGPVTMGNDPRKIDIAQRDRMVTHILPMNNSEMLAAARNAAAEQKDVEVTAAGNRRDGYRIILTGPALSVRRAVETVVAIDPPPAAAPGMFRSIQLTHLDAEGSAAVLNGPYGRDSNGNQVIRAIADKRTNSLIISGPDLEVMQAIQLLQRMDVDALPKASPELPGVVPPPAQTIPPAPPPTPVIPGTRPGPPEPGARLDEIRPGAENSRFTLSLPAPPGLGATGEASLLGAGTASAPGPIGKRPPVDNLAATLRQFRRVAS